MPEGFSQSPVLAGQPRGSDRQAASQGAPETIEWRDFCQWCGVPLESPKPWQKYCSDKCCTAHAVSIDKQQRAEVRAGRTCLACGAPLNAKSSLKQFCRTPADKNRCRKLYMRQQAAKAREALALKCVGCGKPLPLRADGKRLTRRKWCSKNCAQYHAYWHHKGRVLHKGLKVSVDANRGTAYILVSDDAKGGERAA